jgi:surfeit locus 1 family protein
MQKQLPYPILPVYIQQSPDPAWTGLPYRSEPDLDLTEGPHLGYAIQWFTFATILFVGYPFFIHRDEHDARQLLVEKPKKGDQGIGDH